MSTELRLKLLALVFLFFCVGLIGRLFYWQIVKGDELASEARDQHIRGEKIVAKRGDILASDGSWLAASVDSWLLYGSIPEMERPASEIATLLAPLTVEKAADDDEILPLTRRQYAEDNSDDPNESEDEENGKYDYKEALDDEENRIEKALSQPNAKWVPLKQKISRDLKEQIEKLEIKGLGFQLEESRMYPEGSTASHVLGFIGKDDAGNDKGYTGLEGHYDLQLSGREGYLRRELNALGVPLLSQSKSELSASQGVSLITHIDKTVQFRIEKALMEGLEKYDAQSGNIVVMDPKTGGILGMTAYPPYNPGNYSKYSNAYFRNPIISDTFEPGSIFKPIVMASGIDAGLITPQTTCDICDGPFKVDKYFIGTWNDQYYPDSSMVDVLRHSDNVGMVFVGNKLGRDKFYSYLEKFGFMDTSGIDLQGEARSQFREKGKWSLVDLATASFGQGIAVTPIQMTQAIAAIANDGVVMTPQVVDKYTKEGWEEDIKPIEKGRAISEKAADDITAMMVSAVKDGEAKWAVPPGFSIAGKTGTAQIPVSGHYDKDKTIASFVGFAPAHDPQFVMLVTLREPMTSPWASETAAPLWFDIALDLFPYFGIHPDN